MKIIVIDDDPTGSQTVNDCPLLLHSGKENIIQGLRYESKLLFLLANTRSMSPKLAEERIRQICRDLNEVLNDENLPEEDIIFVSRGDSTLRGHAVLEPTVINDELGPFDATIHAPAFFEGGRTTVNGVHLLNGLPVHMTSFASDSIFGYSTSHLDMWLEEKSGGKISSKDVLRITTDLLDQALISSYGFNKLCNFLLNLSGNISVIVDATSSNQLEVLGKAVRSLSGKKRFLFRSAASLINGLANIKPNNCPARNLVSLRLRRETTEMKPGLIMVGSHVPLSDEQLEVLLREPSCVGIELPVEKFLHLLQGGFSASSLSNLKQHLLEELDNLLSSRKTPVLFTTRRELKFESVEERINFGNQLAEFMASLVAKLSHELGYIISKGGITTHYLLEKGLNLSSVHLKGQLLPGLSIVCAANYMAAKNLPILTFPGNLGSKETLLEAWRLMEHK